MGGRQRALVTGATGFIGSHLVRRLVGDGWHVECVVRPGSDLSALPTEAVCRLHDGSTRTLTDIVTEASPHVVFHLASLFISEHTAEQVVPLVASNVLFGAQLLEAMSSAGVSALVNTGTSWQHFDDAEYEPVNLYAATKQAFEDIADYYVSARGLSMLTLELSDTYGPRDPRPKLFKLLADTAALGTTLQMSAGAQLIDLVYIDDVIDAFLRAADLVRCDTQGQASSYSVSATERISLRDLVELYAQVAGVNVRVNWGGRPYREREVMVPATCVPVLPGWQPRVVLHEGIARITHTQHTEA